MSETEKSYRLSPPKKSHCPTCNRLQNCASHGEVYKSWEYEDRDGNSACGGVTTSLFECLGCETVFMEADGWDDQNPDYWYDREGVLQQTHDHTVETFPKPPKRPRPDWLSHPGRIPPELASILNETYVALENNCFTLAAVGLRTAFDTCSAAVQIDPAMTFEEKLDELKSGGYIGQTERELLEVLTDAGSAAAHRGWTPGHSEIFHLTDVLETFIRRVLINGQRVLAIGAGIPPKQKRQKKPAKPAAPA